MPNVPKQFAINPASLYKEWNFQPDKVDQGEAVQAPPGASLGNALFPHLLPAEITGRAEPAQDGAFVAVRGAGWDPDSTVKLTMVGISYKNGPYLVGEAHPERATGAFQAGFYTHPQAVDPEQWTNITLLAEDGTERAQAPIPYFTFYVKP